MTIREMAEASGVSPETVTRKVRELFPERLKSGKTTDLPRLEAILVVENLRKPGFVSPIEPRQNDEVVTRSELAGFAKAIVGEMMKELMPAILSATQQQATRMLPPVQDYFAINAWAARQGRRLTISEAQSLGRAAAALSRAHDREIRRVDDERFGLVGSYHVSILEELMPSG